MSNTGDADRDQEEETEDVSAKTQSEVGQISKQEENGGDQVADLKGEDCNDEEEDEETEQPKDQSEKNPDKVEVKKQPEVLNLNNEVVNMRKEVKRVRALLSRKIIRQITALKKKKGKEAHIEKNQRRVARLLEEIQAMKLLRPDVVTKTALQKSFNFNEVCKNPKSTMSDRAVARIASHPQFRKKIEAIQAAVEAFCEERRKGGKQGERKVKNERGKSVNSLDNKTKNVAEMEKVEKISEELTNGDSIAKDETTLTEPDENKMESTRAAPADEKKLTVETKSVKPASVKKSESKERVRKKQKAKAQKNRPKVARKLTKKQESDLELSDEDKPYYDDSTEERFHEHSSQEETDSDNDFFVGKVSKFKKKKNKNTDEGDKNNQDSAGDSKTGNSVQSELDELESRLKSRAPKLRSVFCSLSQAKSRGQRGKPIRGQGKPTGSGRTEFHKHTKFQKEEKGPVGHKYNRPDPKRSDSVGAKFRGRGRGDVTRQQDRRGPYQAPQQALHPSWEASKKRKEQQGQIVAFQGKKIKFDDDD
nr:serum response factor-binding protein 1-like [Nerophis lumbriciformis]